MIGVLSNLPVMVAHEIVTVMKNRTFGQYFHTDLSCSDCFEEGLGLFALFEVGEQRHVLERVAILVHEAGNLTGKTDVGRGHCGAVDVTVCSSDRWPNNGPFGGRLFV